MAHARLLPAAQRLAALLRQHTMLPTSWPEVREFLRAVEAEGRAPDRDPAPPSGDEQSPPQS